MAGRLPNDALNGICPYFTMFPLDFPLGILSRRASEGDAVLDPFCGRGTTNFAARLAGLDSLGVDSSPVAAAITASKLVAVTVDEVLAEATDLMTREEALSIPQGEFWEWAFHPEVLSAICKFREAFLEDCTTPTRIALRGILLGALHGPRQKMFASYLSNQSPRTYAPKPAYAVRYWRERELVPEQVDVLGVVGRRAQRYYEDAPEASGAVRLADSRVAGALRPEEDDRLFNWIITSPPYYGMRTYIPDQWLRNWFVGGTHTVDYGTEGQVVHSSPDDFANDLRQVWLNATAVTTEDARMVIRFGGISDRSADPRTLIRDSLAESGWRIQTLRQAGSALSGKRQADSFLRERTQPLIEYDVWAVKR